MTPRAVAMRAGAMLTGLSAVLAAPAASACPVCAQRQEGALGSIALGVFILMPWLVAITVGHYIRKQTLGKQAPKVESEE